MIFQDDCLFPHLSVAANIRFGLKGWRARRRPTPGWPRSRRSAAWSGCWIVVRKRSPAASGSGSAWPGRWRPAPGSCSATSRSRPSTWPTAMRSSIASATSSAPRRSPCSTSPTASPRPSRWARPAVPAGRRENRRRRPAAGRPGRGRPTRRRIDPFEGVRNIFPARIEGHAPEHGATHLRLDDGPELIVGFLDRPDGQPGARRDPRRRHPAGPTVPIAGLSARNQIPGTVERIVPHGPEAEVVDPHRRPDLDRQPRRPGRRTARA